MSHVVSSPRSPRRWPGSSAGRPVASTRTSTESVLSRRRATALRRAGLGWSDLAAVELNEAFAAQSLACLREWPELDPQIVNQARRCDRHRPPTRLLGSADRHDPCPPPTPCWRQVRPCGDVHRRWPGHRHGHRKPHLGLTAPPCGVVRRTQVPPNTPHPACGVVRRTQVGVKHSTGLSGAAGGDGGYGVERRRVLQRPSAGDRVGVGTAEDLLYGQLQFLAGEGGGDRGQGVDLVGYMSRRQAVCSACLIGSIRSSMRTPSSGTTNRTSWPPPPPMSSR